MKQNSTFSSFHSTHLTASLRGTKAAAARRGPQWTASLAMSRPGVAGTRPRTTALTTGVLASLPTR